MYIISLYYFSRYLLGWSVCMCKAQKVPVLRKVWEMLLYTLPLYVCMYVCVYIYVCVSVCIYIYISFLMMFLSTPVPTLRYTDAEAVSVYLKWIPHDWHTT
jgi:hypothetical protein